MSPTRNLLLTLLPILLTSPVLPQDAKESKPAQTGALDEKTFASLHELKQGEVSGLRGSMIEVGGAKAYLSLPQGEKPTAAVLVIHEWWGLNDHIKLCADRLAADGYAALAIDLYDGVVATTRDGAMTAMKAVDAEVATKTLVAAHAFLAADDRVKATHRACIGWCFGGGWSLKLAMAAPDLDAAVVFYGHLSTDSEKLARIKAPILGVFGDKDRSIPPLAVTKFAVAMKKAEKSLVLHRYPANHAFANPSSARYDAENAGKAWQKVRAFLRSHLATGKQSGLVTGEFKMGSRKVEYAAPGDWQVGGPRTMRSLTFKLGPDSECYVVALGGAAGGPSANINRWRQQMGQDALTDAELAALRTLKVLGEDAILVRIAGSYQGMSGEKIDDARMLGLVCSLPSQTLFVKMIGKKDVVAAQAKAFQAFCASFR